MRPVRQVHFCVQVQDGRCGGRLQPHVRCCACGRLQLSARCDDDVSESLLKMACEVAGLLEQCPGAVDVVLVNSEQWTEYHRAIMEALVEGVRMFFANAEAPVI